MKSFRKALEEVRSYNKKSNKYDNTELTEKLDDSDKERITGLRERIKDLEEQQQRLRDQISQIKRSAGVDVQ